MSKFVYNITIHVYTLLSSYTSKMSTLLCPENYFNFYFNFLNELRNKINGMVKILVLTQKITVVDLRYSSK